MKQKSRRRFLGLDYTTALVVGTILLFLFALLILAVSLVQRHMHLTQDYTFPLTVTNLEYCNGEKLDLSVPQSGKPVPLVIYVHGGGWKYGSKVTDKPDFLKPLVSKDVAIARINYRLSGSAKFPAAVQDVLCSVRFLRANQRLFNIDPEKIALIGYSSGGNIAALAALGSNNSEFVSGGYEEYGSQVRALVTLSAHLSLGASNFTDLTEEYLSAWLKSPEARRRADPITYVDRDDPRALIFHARDDEAVPYSQAEAFKKVADQKGHITTLIPVENAGHSFSSWFGRDSPNSEKRHKILENFLLDQFNK